MIGWLQNLFLDKRAREALQTRPAPKGPTRGHGVTVPPPERDVRTALAEAEERMRRLPPEKAQLIRSALLVRRASQSALASLSEDEVDKLRQVAEKALLGGGR